jgi:hypothetical protein
MSASDTRSGHRACSLDHLIGSGEHVFWYFEAKRLGCRQIDEKRSISVG